jgi:NADH-quinone oxidoreductase subunit L
MIVAAGALSGLPPLSGFFSKELILGRLLELNNPFWFAAGIFGVFLTAYYTFRLVFILLFPSKTESAVSDHAHQEQHNGGGAFAMSAVLWVLASVTIVLGLLLHPLQHFFNHALGAQPVAVEAHHAWLPIVSCVLALGAIGLAWLEFGRRKAAQTGFVERLPGLADLFGQRWYLDHLYRILLDKCVYRGISRLFNWNDKRVIDSAVDGLGGSAIGLGRISARLHAGTIQHRLMVMVAVIITLALYFGLSAL